MKASATLCGFMAWLLTACSEHETSALPRDDRGEASLALLDEKVPREAHREAAARVLAGCEPEHGAGMSLACLRVQRILLFRTNAYALEGVVEERFSAGAMKRLGVDPLLLALQDNRLSENARLGAVRSILKFDVTPKVASALLRETQRVASDDYFQALSSLLGTLGDDALNNATRLLSDPVAAVRKHALEVYREALRQGLPIDVPELQPLATHLLNDPEPAIRERAKEVLYLHQTVSVPRSEEILAFLGEPDATGNRPNLWMLGRRRATCGASVARSMLREASGKTRGASYAAFIGAERARMCSTTASRQDDGEN